MNPLLIGPIAGLLNRAMDAIFPDPAEAARAKLEIARMAQDGRLAEMADETSRLNTQVEVNKIEAGSGNIWSSGWRPAFGWIGAAVVLSQFILRPFAPWVMEVFGFHVPPIPSIDMEALWPLILGILGLSWNRSQDKKNGVA